MAPKRRTLVSVLWLEAAVLAFALVLVPVLLVGSDPDKVETAADMPVGVSFGNRLTSLSDDDLDQALDDLVELHTPWIRMDLAWTDLQPDGPDSWSLEKTDHVVDEAHERGIRILGIVTYTPAWARDAGCDSFACPPADPATFATFAGKLADRYAGRINAYEVWNEPNYAMFWPEPDAGRYGALLQPTSKAIHAADPSARVLLGGLAALEPGPKAVDAARFLRGACAAERCADIDAVAYHPYTFPRLATDDSEPSTTWQRMRSRYLAPNGLRPAMEEAGLDDLPIWVTEYGAPTDGTSDADHVSEKRQAEIAVSGLRAASSQSSVGGLFWYTWRDLEEYGSNEDHFGLRRADGTKKPAFDAISRALSP